MLFNPLKGEKNVKYIKSKISFYAVESERDHE